MKHRSSQRCVVVTEQRVLQLLHFFEKKVPSIENYQRVGDSLGGLTIALIRWLRSRRMEVEILGAESSQGVWCRIASLNVIKSVQTIGRTSSSSDQCVTVLQANPLS